MMADATKRQSPNWLDLPEDLLTSKIFTKVGATDILNNVERVCTLWRKICKNPSIWRRIDMPNLGDLHNKKLKMMCRHAVDRSNGQLEYINIRYFGTDDLLIYIADRSNCLRKLRLVFCSGVSDMRFSEAAAKLSLLEELDISLCSNVSEETLKIVGKSCPLLKSLKFNSVVTQWPVIEVRNDQQALAIAENMHELLHLQLVGNKLTNVGLEAILDGCPNLESLDLRQCFSVSMEEVLGVERIRELQCPNDFIVGYDKIEAGPDGVTTQKKFFMLV